ncbi:MAG: mechanosensitive ion channel domain-containing protein [Gammaproteobacteria bacterium]
MLSLLTSVQKLPADQESAQKTAKSDSESSRQTAIKSERSQLAEQIKATEKKLDSAISENRTEPLTSLKQQLTALQELDAIFAQQSIALQSNQTLRAEQLQYRSELNKLDESDFTEPVAYIDLDKIHEEIDGLGARQSALTAKLKQARLAFDKTQGDLKESRKVLGSNESKLSQSPDDLEHARTNLGKASNRLAEQTLRLRQIEKSNAELALSVHSDQRKLLEKRLSLLERHAVFDRIELNAQLQEIEKRIFDLKRQLSRANNLQVNTSARVAEAQRRFTNNAIDQPEIADEVEAKRLADEAVKVSIDLLGRRLERLENWKIVWQRRYAIINSPQNQAEWLNWKQDATANLETLNQEDRRIQLWLNDWQKQLITLRNELNDSSNTGNNARRWIELQKQQVEDIVAAYQEQTIFLENSRRLHQKLIDLIADRTEHRHWKDWFDIALKYQIYGNRVEQWTGAAGSAIGLFSLLVFVRNNLTTRLQVHAEADAARVAAQFFASVRRTTTFFLFMISVFISAFWLSLDLASQTILKNLTMVALIFQGAVWLSYFFSAWIRSYLGAKAKRDATSKGALSIFNFVSQVAVWSIALLLILQNLGVDVTALATGLGIGGVAVALALQRILGDLFSSLSIVLDKPFVAGDFIIVDQVLGTVEHIGIKTTRIRALDGEQIICANSDLLNTRIRNFQRMHQRRVAFQLGVIYQTELNLLRQIPQMLKDVVEAQDHTRFDRAHFKSYGDFALIFEIVYYVDSADYNLYMDIQQTINLAIYERFMTDGIEFAYPTQSLYLQQQTKQMVEPALG